MHRSFRGTFVLVGAGRYVWGESDVRTAAAVLLYGSSSIEYIRFFLQKVCGVNGL